MTEAECLQRAVVAQRGAISSVYAAAAERRWGRFGSLPAAKRNLRAMLKAVDSFAGDPTEDDILTIAWKHCEAPQTIRIAFEARASRKRVRADPFKGRANAWLRDEDRIVRRMATARNAAEVAGTLNGLTVNCKRGVTRTLNAVKERRLFLLSRGSR